MYPSNNEFSLRATIILLWYILAFWIMCSRFYVNTHIDTLPMALPFFGCESAAHVVFHYVYFHVNIVSRIIAIVNNIRKMGGIQSNNYFVF